MAARRRIAPPPFSSVADLARTMARQCDRIAHISWAIYGQDADDAPDADKVEVARTLLKKSLARHLTVLVGTARQINVLLDDAPPLTAGDEAWLRRQLEGLEGGGR